VVILDVKDPQAFVEGLVEYVAKQRIMLEVCDEGDVYGVASWSWRVVCMGMSTGVSDIE